MSTMTKICPECGRIHRDTTTKCWTCYKREWMRRGGAGPDRERNTNRLRHMGWRRGVTVATLLAEGQTTCHVCHREVDTSADIRSGMAPSVDHLIDLGDGGSLDRSNVAMAHRSHNTARAWAARRSMDNGVTEGRLFQHTGI